MLITLFPKLYPYTVSEAMFHQVRVLERDSDFLRFLRKDPIQLGSKSSAYKMLVHIFGTRDSRSYLSYVLRKIAYDFCNEFGNSVCSNLGQLKSSIYPQKWRFGDIYRVDEITSSRRFPAKQILEHAILVTC